MDMMLKILLNGNCHLIFMNSFNWVCQKEPSLSTQSKTRRGFHEEALRIFLEENIKNEKTYYLNKMLLRTLSRYSWRPLPGRAGAPIFSA